MPDSEFCSVECDEAFTNWVDAQEEYDAEHTEVVTEPRRVKMQWRPFRVDTPKRNPAVNGHHVERDSHQPRSSRAGPEDQ